MTPLLDERLHDYLDGRLPPAERALLERALAADPELARALDLLRATSRAMRELPLVSAPASLRAAIGRDVEAARHTVPARVHRLFRSLDRSLLAASLVGALVVGGALVVSWGPSGPSGVRDVLASRPVDTREVKVGLVEVERPAQEPALAFLESNKQPDELAKAAGTDDARLRAGKPADVNDHAEEIAKGGGEGGAAHDAEKQPQEAKPGLELERLKDLERQKVLLELQQRGQIQKPGTTAAPPGEDKKQLGADGPKSPSNSPAPPAPAKAAGARPAGDPGRSKDGPEEEKAKEGDLQDKFKGDAQDVDGKNTKALGDGATPASRQQPTPAADPASDAAKKMEEGLGSAGAPGGSSDGGRSGENAERLARRHRLAQDRAAREAGDLADDGARRAAHASCRPLELVSADPERIAVLLQSHAEREGLAIRREQVEGGWVVELEDLSLAQAERLRSATRGLAPTEEAERARWGFAGRSDVDREALRKAELKKAEDVPEASATPGAAQTGKPGSPQAEGGAGGAWVAPPAAQPTPKSAPPRDEHTGAPPPAAPPKADASSDGRPNANEPRQGEHGGKRAEHPVDAPNEAVPPAEAPGGLGGASSAGETRRGDLAEDALELRARRLAATEKLRSLEKGLTDVARDARKELDAERNERADQDRPLPRYSLRIVIRRQ